MKTLFYNPETKVIYASEDSQPEAMQEIANIAVPDLIANGATVDSSADSLLTPADAGNAVADAPAPDASATGLAMAGEEGNAGGAAGDAQSAPTPSPMSTGNTTAPDMSGATSVSSTGTDSGNAVAAVDTSPSATAAADVNSAPLVSTASADAVPLVAGGTTVAVTQVGDQSVNTNVQNGNQLAGSDVQQATGNVLVNDTPTVDAPALDGDTKTIENVENDLNPLVPAAGTEGAPASQLAAQAAEPEAEPLPRESHLMLLEAKFESAMAKLRNGERVFIEELDAIYAHVKAVL